jgi:hypothetical protein
MARTSTLVIPPGTVNEELPGAVNVCVAPCAAVATMADRQNVAAAATTSAGVLRMLDMGPPA